MKTERSFWLLLVLGLALRCLAINHPLVDAHLLRQCQTADATRSLMEQPGIPLSSTVPWLGDTGARYLQELPVFNYAVIGVYHLIGNLDISGKVTSIVLWAVSFICLQMIWKRLLRCEQVFWANLVFVVAPLEVFYGQAFMPEMLVQLLGFAFVLFVIRYSEQASLIRWSLCALTGFAALIVKLPETGHLYWILGFLLFQKEGWRGLFRPRYLIAAALTAVSLKLWGSYVDSVNQTSLPEWTSKETLQGFIGKPGDRLEWKPWMMICLYLLAFAAPGPVMLPALRGLWTVIREQRNTIPGAWIVSLGLFYILWFGNGGARQGYYNLPAMAPLCALFAIGMDELLRRAGCWRRTVAASGMIVAVISAVPGCLYLFQQDRQIFAASLATRDATKPDDLILFRPNHRWDMIDYPYNPVLTYYSQRRTFVWTQATPERYREAALERARYAVVTSPRPPARGIAAYVNRLRGTDLRKPEGMDWLESAGFKVAAREPGFAIYKRE